MDHEPTSEELTLHFLELERVIERVGRSSTHYQVLGLERAATRYDIGVAHRHTMSLLNPMDFRHESLPPNMTAQIRETLDKVVNAYIVLNNFGSRVEYDNLLVHRAPVPIPFSYAEVPENRSGPLLSLSQPGMRAILQDSPTLAATEQSAAPLLAQQVVFFDKPQAHEASSDTIDIKYSTTRALFTKSAEDSRDIDKRKYQRLKLSIPTYVVGYDHAQGKWTEIGHTLDVSIGGVALQVAKEMPEGAVVHLTIPMPTKLRRHGYSDPTYQVYAIVRRVQTGDRDQRVVGVEFLGASPPIGYLKKPWAKFQTKW